VRDEEILLLKESLKGVVESIEITGVKAGDVIEIPKGPFEGKEGTVKQIKKIKYKLF